MIIKNATRQSFGNAEAVRKSAFVSCYFCIRRHLTASVSEWADSGTTAICPNCEVDAILPGWHSDSDLAETHKKWFAALRKPLPAYPLEVCQLLHGPLAPCKALDLVKGRLYCRNCGHEKQCHLEAE